MCISNYRYVLLRKFRLFITSCGRNSLFTITSRRCAPLSGSRAFGGQRKPAGCGCLAAGSILCPTAQSVAAAVKVLAQFYMMLIFFPTMTPIDIRPSPYVTHTRYASACKISPPHVAPFHRR